ncbi:hypothetical protein P280DRAFT_102027 [Massarina eburnea CBS 473.64]|uniref:Uncharacterized protein n=1 Tax=Massarina eburnea CBS 473.64 TaxID=1395130 RepID=A0A6A6RQN0_9PLEO|nr:hypothetical protein P280DRAFT_102027 [Massarina eburnea CBS 473.64]
MADKLAITTTPRTHSPTHSRSGSTSNPPPFTPRSTTFHDNSDSDSDDTYNLTPVESPEGPQYDDLPPTYDEAQRDALNGVGAIALDSEGEYQVPGSVEASARGVEVGELETERNSDGGVDVNVGYVGGCERVDVGRVRIAPAEKSGSNEFEDDEMMSLLLGTALEFTRHEPEGDVLFAPKLTRCVAIPQISPTKAGDGKGKGKAKEKKEGRRDRRKGRGDRHVPGQWPDASNETTSTTCANEDGKESIQFLRTYAPVLDAHSIRPAEFLDFLDGLNALCALSPDGLYSDIVRNFVETSDDVFFAPRGLRVSIKTLSTLLDAAKVPEERAQKASVAASALTDNTTTEGRAKSLYPWTEALEFSVAGPSEHALMLDTMVQNFKEEVARQSGSGPSQTYNGESSTRNQSGNTEKAAVENEDEDPPHSVPGAFPEQDGQTSSPFSGWRGGRGSRGGFRGRGHRGRHEPWSPFGAPGNTPFGPPGYGPFGAPGNFPFGPFGPGRANPGRGGPFACGFRASPGCGTNNNQGNEWEAWGQNIGKWGEEFGKRMGEWGEELGKRAEWWGNDIEKRSEAWGEHVAAMSGQVHPGMQSGERSRKTKDDDDDDASSISSDSSSSSSSSYDSDSDLDFDDDESTSPAAKAFQERMREINTVAESSRLKGKKPLAAIDHDRALGISQAEKERTALEQKMVAKRTKRQIIRDFRGRKKALKKEWSRRRMEMKKKGLGKKSREWKEMTKGYRERKKVLGKEKKGLKRDFKGERERERAGRNLGGESGGEGSRAAGVGNGMEEMVWVVIENLE